LVARCNSKWTGRVSTQSLPIILFIIEDFLFIVENTAHMPLKMNGSFKHNHCILLEDISVPLFIASQEGCSLHVFVLARGFLRPLRFWHKISLTFSNELTILVLYPNAFRNAALAARMMQPDLKDVLSTLLRFFLIDILTTLLRSLF
jgi:hypothetical protein